MLDRATSLARVRAARVPWDMIVVGGGATGLGTAVDAASRGYSTLLLERGDFGCGTSSRSTKLIHGGVRYLQQGNLALVREALAEREILRRNAPHLIHDLRFVVPVYDWWEIPFYGAGLRFYDLLAGRQSFGRSHLLSRLKTAELLPTIERRGLRGGVLYHDGQFDDARLAIELAKTAAAHGAALANYARVTNVTPRASGLSRVAFRDEETGEALEAEARVVVNAAGPFVDGVRRLEDASAAPILRASQGIHLVLDASFLAGDLAIVIPHTDDGRVLFVVPWKGRALVGTTDTPVDVPNESPKPFAEEINFLLAHAARYLRRDPSPSDVLCAFAGLRPLVRDDARGSTATLSRDHVVTVSSGGLVTITGGKWTTYRKMAEDAVDTAAKVAGLTVGACRTKDLPIGARTSEGLPIPDDVSVEHAVREEMARSVEDFLSRRTRALLLGAQASLSEAPTVAREMAALLGRDAGWESSQLESYAALVAAHLPKSANAADPLFSAVIRSPEDLVPPRKA